MEFWVVIEWIATVFSLVGGVLNALKIKICFYLWLIANFIWIVYAYYHGMYGQLLTWIVFSLIAGFGLYQWSKGMPQKEKERIAQEAYDEGWRPK